jgi:hypothetical protein
LPIGGVLVTLTGTDAAGNTVNRTTYTDAVGYYEFTDLLAGTYTVTEAQPTRYPDGKDSVGSLGGTTTNDVHSAITLAAGGNGVNYDFGELPFVPDTPGVWIGGVVYYDANRDGAINTGDQPMAGVTLNLLNSVGAIVGTTVTNADGSYYFTGLTPGASYTIVEDQLVGYGSSEAPTNSIPVVAPLTGSQLGYDFGETLSTLSGTVFRDDNDNGVQDPGEPGIPGVEVVLSGTQADGTEILRTATTDVLGDYVFTELLGGSYSVEETQPAGYVDGKDRYNATAYPPLTTNDLHAAIELPNGVDAPDYDFGELNNPAILTFLEGTVFWDKGANGYSPDGTLQPGEPGLGGVTVILYDANGLEVARTVTLADGSYRFDGIVPGTYRVVELQPDGYGSSSPNEVTAVVPNLGISNVNFGETLGATYGTVFSDMNGDGIRDPGEPGIGGVTITLTGFDENDNPVVRTTVTNPDGSWSISGLLPSDRDGYILTETQPGSWLDGSDASSKNGTITNDKVTGVVIGPGAVVESGNYGEIAPVRVGDLVWLDENANGVQDLGERGIANVTVTLTGRNDRGEAVSLSTTTDSNGSYLFDGLRPGTYTISFTDPAGMLPTYAGLGTATTGSDPSGVCRCYEVTLTGNPDPTSNTSDRLDIDSGYFVPVSLSGSVFNDNNREGTYNPGDSPRGGQQVTVTGAGPDGQFGTPDDIVIVVTTKPDGTYEVGNLPPGQFRVETQGRPPTLVTIPPGGVGQANFPYPPASGVLPRTGAEALRLMLLALGAIGLGSMLVIGTRRRRQIA